MIRTLKRAPEEEDVSLLEETMFSATRTTKPAATTTAPLTTTAVQYLQ
jgi:hypothetical protein